MQRKQQTPLLTTHCLHNETKALGTAECIQILVCQTKTFCTWIMILVVSKIIRNLERKKTGKEC